MTNLIEQLLKEHRQLIALTGEMETMIRDLNDPVSPVVEGKFRGLIDPLIELLIAHDELERRELFPILQERIPEANQWQVRMVEVQDEMILAEARHFQEHFSGSPSPASAERIKKKGAQLFRWIREHVAVEEQNLFPLVEE
jgi:hemerythrin-like domain-containing protein